MRERRARLSLPQLTVVIAIVWGVFSLLTGCSGYSVTDPSYYAAITAGSNSIRVTQQMQIANNAKITGVPLTFYVNGIAGGNAEVGTIDATGLYTAPAVVPIPNNVTITSDTGNAKYPPGTLTLAVLNPIPVITSVTPTGFSEGTTLVTVDGSQFVYGAQILWNGAPVTTTFQSGTQLLAAIDAPNAGTYPLTVENPDPGAANAATVSVIVAPGQVVLTLQPNAGADVRVRNTLNIGLMVTGTNNTAVNVFINGIAGGNAQLGTVVANADGSIAYTAPPVVPTPNNVVQLSVVSVDNPTVSVNQNIAVLNPIPILNSATPDSMPASATTVVLTGSDFINGATVLMNGAPATNTTFNSGTQLTATITPTQPGNVDLQVLNPSPGPATSADLIADVQGTVPVPPVSLADAARFLDQATFGATDSEIQNVSKNGYQAWLTQQFNMPQTLAEPAVEQGLILNNPACAGGDLKCNAALFVQNNQAEIYVENQFWQQSLTASDELRQRVAYSLLSQFVISGTTPQVQSMPRGEANYYDVLGADAFGNFRQLLNDVTLNPAMGNFLSMLGNDKGNATTDPDENYAREIMQLFTIGLWQLNDDGTRKLDTNGQPIPTYSNVDVTGLAKVFTGFSWQVPGDTSDAAWSNCCEYVGTGFGEDLLPMTAYPSHHSTLEKDFLGVTIPASGSPDPTGDLKIALDTLFNHPNLPPFFCKQLIEHMVTSNPSPAYVARVAAVFENNGSSVRGDMKAVITAMLLDPEARNASADLANPQYGKVREALVRYTEWARAFTAQSRNGFYNLGSTEDPIWGLGQMPFRSPTVFNWFAPNYVPPGTSIETAGLEGPEFQMTNVSSVVGYLNYMQGAIGSDATGGSDIYANYGTEMALAATPDALMDRINLLLMGGEMSSTLRSEVEGAVEAIAIPTGDQDAINAALKARVQTAIYLTMASPDFAAQY